MLIRYNLPSVATLTRLPLASGWTTRCLNRTEARELRRFLEANYDHPQECLEYADSVMCAFGVESIPEGDGANSPAIEYVNMGDAYAATLLFVNGRFRVGCWGDIVERGNYA